MKKLFKKSTGWTHVKPVSARGRNVAYDHHFNKPFGTKAELAWNGGRHTLYFKENTEEGLWKLVAEFITGAGKNLIKTPNAVTITVNGHKANVFISEGDNGTRYYVSKQNDIVLKHSLYETKLLRLVDINDNRRLFYDLIPNNMGPYTLDVGCRYGKIGEDNGIEGGKVARHPSPSYMYWIKYYAKINEGYDDLTDEIGQEDDPIEKLFPEKVETPEKSDAQDLYDLLSGSAKEAIAVFNVDWMKNKIPYNKKQVASCWKAYSDLTEAVNEKNSLSMANCANQAIKKLIELAKPNFSKGTSVKSFMITPKYGKNGLQKTLDELKKTIDDWNTKITVMEGYSNITKSTTKRLSPFGNVGVRLATDDEFKHFQNLIAKEDRGKVGMLKKVWILDPKDRKKNYEEALAKAQNKTEKEYFHGSYTSNMVSLISCGGPTIHVAAAFGRMFGNGSYWASSFDKSLGYTSYNGSRWASGSSNVAYMLVGRVHYGKPYHPQAGEHAQAEEKVKKGGYDVCHAIAKQVGLRKDEIITYDEEHSYVEAILQIGD